MCWSAATSVAMVGIGAAATAVTISRGMPRAIPAALGYFTVMELLQSLAYPVVGQCGNPANQTITFLSMLHIVFQPFFINAFALELVPQRVRSQMQVAVYLACAASAAVMLLQLYPFAWAGVCQLGTSLCGSTLCTVPGEWHIAWQIPYNGLLLPLEDAIGIHAGFPTYMLTVFLLPLAYGAWRFVLFHAVAGPLLANLLTSNPNEIPAVWCLFSIGLLIVSLSPMVRSKVECRSWYGFGGTAQTS
ncbi:MAG: hypothetical protein GC150_13070 [Rhizobiales bacterium]|nr:hypothetical protein [Hyphomicrobiales bacterium]